MNDKVVLLIAWLVLLLVCYINFEIPGQIGAPFKILFSEGIDGLVMNIRSSPQSVGASVVVATFQASLFTGFLWNIRRDRSQHCIGTSKE